MAQHPGHRDISRGANGVAAITRQARDEDDAAALTYIAVYACGFAGRGANLERYRSLRSFGRDDTFVARLRHEVPDNIEFSGWTVTGRDGDRILLAQDGVRAFTWGDELESTVQVGDRPIFLSSALQGGLMPGFVARRGASPADRSSLISRLYLNIKPAAASWVLGPLARRLDGADVPYEMKVLAHPGAYIRRDASVLYVSSETEAVAIEVVARALDEVGFAAVRRPTPRLTGWVAPGVGLAHEPTDISATGGLSHGQWVAGLFHEAAQSATDPRAIAARVRTLIADAGRDPRHPHLRGSGPKPVD